MARYGLDENGERIPSFDEAFPDNAPALIDHYAEAEKILEQSFDWTSTDVGQLAQLLRAQVHATLATVFEQ